MMPFVIGVTLILTILIEFLVLLFLRERRGKVLGLSVVANILTNVPLNLYLTYVDFSSTTIFLGEVLVFLFEALWYYMFLRILSRAVVYSFLCNAISFLIGALGVIILYVTCP